MPKVGRLTGPSKADGTQVQPSLQLGGIDLGVLGPNADVTIGGELTVQGVSMTPTALDDLPEVSTPLDGTELVAVEQSGVAVQATTAQLIGTPAESALGVGLARIRAFSDFGDFTTAVTASAQVVGGQPFRSNLSGTAAGITQGQGLGEIGVADCTTGTTTTGRCAIEPGYGLLLLFDEDGTYKMGARVRMPAVSDGTNTYRVVIGLCDMTSVTPANGFFFRSPTAAGNWSAVIRKDSTDLAVIDTGVATDNAGSNFHEFVVAYEPDLGARWWIDGTLVASDATNRPDLLDNVGSLGASIIKSAGTTARVLEVDALSFDIPLAGRFFRMP